MSTEKSRMLCNNSRSKCVYHCFHQFIAFPLGNIRAQHGFQKENIQHTNVHLVVPDTHAVLKVWFKYIYISGKWNINPCKIQFAECGSRKNLI